MARRPANPPADRPARAPRVRKPAAAAAVATAPVFFELDEHPHPDGTSTMLGFWIYLMSDCLIFAMLFATFGVLGGNYAAGPGPKDVFELPLIAVNTSCLLISSITYGFAMLATQNRNAGRASIEIVPGVTSLTAAAAVAARPLAARNEVLKVLPAPLPDERLRAELEAAEAVAIIKVGRHFDRIRALLGETGYAASALVVEHATTARQRITPLGAFGHDDRPYFSTILAYRGAEAWGA